MKKLFIVATIFSIAFLGNVHAQQNLFTGSFNLEFSDEVKIRTGSAAQKKSTSEWASGSKVGKHNIKPETFQKLQENVDESFSIEIRKKNFFGLHEMWATSSKTGKKTKGAYNSKTNEFAFGSSKGSQGANKDCGSLEIGIVKGKLNADKSAIEDGEFKVGFVAGCKPVIVSADATFYYTGVSK